MKDCKNIKNKLSLYVDDVLPAEDKRKVEEHLKTCAQCKQALAELQKVKAMTSQLSEVETPPWFKQKIMAQVRTEAEKKSSSQKGFYPSRMKIPVRVFAAIFIVVIAVYMYRSGGEQFEKAIQPEATAPVMETQKDELPAKKDLHEESEKVVETGSGVRSSADVTCDDKACRVNETVGYSSVEGSLPGDKEKSQSQVFSTQLKGEETDQVPAMSEKKSKSLQASMERAAIAVRSEQIKNTIVLKSPDIQTAAEKAEKILAEYNAAKISKQSTEAKVIFRAEISKEKLKDFIEKLKTIGAIEDKVSADGAVLEQIPVVIEIQEQ